MVCELLEADIEKNQRTLQQHLDEVVAKRLADLKRATIRAVAKGGDSEEQIASPRRVALIGSRRSARQEPLRLRVRVPESQIRRDPGSGQFQTKVKHTQKKPIQGKVAADGDRARTRRKSGTKGSAPK